MLRLQWNLGKHTPLVYSGCGCSCASLTSHRFDTRSLHELAVYPTAGSAITSEMRLLEAARPESAWKVVLPRKTDVEYEVAHRGDHLFILLRDPERPNSELLVAPLSDPTKTTVGLSWPHSYSRHSDVPVKLLQ